MAYTPEQIQAAKQAYENALTAEQVAKKIVDDIKASHAATVKTYEDAKAAFDALKPSATIAKAKLTRAEADVTITRAEYAEVDPDAVATILAKGASNAELLAATKAFLADKPNGASNEEIYNGVVAAGLQMAGEKPKANFTTYLHRWGSAGALADKGLGRWGLGDAATPPVVTPPAFLGGTPSPEPTEQAPVVTPPAFLGTPAVVEPTNIDPDVFGADFPGVEALNKAGYTLKSQMTGATKEQLVAISGIGNATADKILAALV